VGLSRLRWWRVVGTALARVLLVVGLGSLLLVWGGGSAFAAQAVPIPVGSPMDDGSYAVCTVGYVWIGVGHGAPWDTQPYDNMLTIYGGGAIIGIAVNCNTAFAGAQVTVDLEPWDGSSPMAAGFGLSSNADSTDGNGQLVFTPVDGASAGFTNCVTDDIDGLIAYNNSQGVPNVAPYFGEGALSPCDGDENSVGNYSCSLSYQGAGYPCEIEAGSSVYVGGPPEPWPYWAGQAASSQPYSADLSCSVISLDNQSGDYEVAASWANASGVPNLLSSGTLTTESILMEMVTDSNSDVSLTLSNERYVPWTDPGPGALGGNFLGTVGNPSDVVSGGEYIFQVEALAMVSTGSGTFTATADCEIGTPGVTPPGGTICPSGPGTCANLSNCTLDDVTVTMPGGWLVSWLGISAPTLTIPDPVAVPGWVWCIAQQAGEWAFYPTGGVLTSWQDFGSSAETHVPVVYLYDGSHWMFSFTNELHNQIPSNYVSTSCMSITPATLPNGKGGSFPVGGGQLCGAGATLKGSDQVVAGSSDVEELLSILLVLGFAVGLVGISVQLLRSGGK